MGTPEGRNIGYTPREDHMGGNDSPGSVDSVESTPAILGVDPEQLRQKVAFLRELGIAPAEVRGEPHILLAQPPAQGSPETS